MHNVNDYNSLKEYKQNSLFSYFSDTERNQITDPISEKKINYLKFRSTFFEKFPNISLRIQSIKSKFFPTIIQNKILYKDITSEDLDFFYKEKINILKLYNQLSLIFDFQLILMTQPENYKNFINLDQATNEGMPLNQNNFITRLHKRSNEVSRQFARANKLQIIDLALHMNNKIEYFYDNIHYNDEGSKIIAMKIFNNIKDNIN